MSIHPKQSLKEKNAELEKQLQLKNRELEIEAALERVRTAAMGMLKPDDLSGICGTMFHELKKLGFDELRNAMIDIHYDDQAYLLNYDYAENSGRTVNRFMYNSHPIVNNIVNHARHSTDVFTEKVYAGNALKEWRDFRKKNGEADDPGLDGKDALYYYFYSIGTGAIGISTYSVANPEQLEILKRFRNVFDLAYKRYTDIAKAEAQAKEAQIEIALERIRARAMAMQSSDELIHVANVMREQLGLLGKTELETLAVHLYNDDSEVFDSWYAVRPSEQTTGEIFTGSIQFRKDSCAYVKDMIAGYKCDADEYTLIASGAKHKEWTAVVKKAAPIFNEILKGTLPPVTYSHMNDFSGGSTVMVSYEPPSEESKALQKRFTSVFDLGYRRFVDLKQAEAQAREAKIETALEKVRARTMAMYKGEELADTAILLFDQLSVLGIKQRSCGFLIMDEQSETMADWSANLDAGGKATIVTGTLSFNQHPILAGVVETWKKGAPYFIGEVHGDKLQQYYGDVTAKESASDDIKQKVLAVATSEYTNSFYFQFGMMYVLTPEPLTEHQINIMLRLAAVFKLTYTRFLDLQKAEAQAREGQIQLALERVRARTMAMQHSDELSETVFILFQQFRELGENPDQATIGIINEEDKVIEYWVTMYGSRENRVFKFSIGEPDVTRKIYDAWKAHEKSLVIDLTGKSLKDFSTYRASKGGAAFNKAEKQRIINVAFFSKGLINVQSTAVRSEESIKLLERFAAVFDGTYTRFLDLQKAEAQAREAQIELGLERVRARAMAMQNSSELAGLVATVLGELKKLDFALSWCLITIVDYDAWACRVWMANAHVDQLPQSYYLPFTDLPFQKAIMQAWKERKTKWFYELKGDDKKATDEYMFTKTDYRKLPPAAQNSIRSLDPAFFSFTFSNFGGLQTGGPQPLSEANLDILSRFGKVFDNTYTRFNDLQKAEAQARESQIQLALERVRARTMAMQHSSELADASFVLDSQVRSLGIETRGCAFNIYGENESTEWFSSEAGSLPPYKTPRENIFLTYYQAGQQGESLHIREHDVEACAAHYEYLCTLPGVGESLKSMKESGGSFPARQIDHAAYFKYGYLLFITLAPAPEAHDIFKRFAKVFEQTYTRFLDLQKVEAQAREAQIEAALERVRSRSIGMQKSDELKEVIQIIYEQFVHLNIDIEHTGFVVDYEPGGDWHFWIADQLGAPNKLKVANYDCEWNNSFDNAREKGIDFFAINLDFDEKNKFYRDLFSHADEVPEEIQAIYLSKPGLAISTVLMEDVALYIENFEGTPYTDEENATLMRFGKVFQQTYTRFLDLQKAEAQAREAQIQLGLERVRARAMAMQTSEELNTLVGTLFEELTKLDFVLTRCLIMIFDPETLGSRWWMANSETPAEPMSFLVQNHDNPAYLAYLKAWRELVSTWQYELKGKVKRDWDDFLFVDTGLSHLPAPVIDGMKAPETVLLSASFNNFGCLTLVSLVPMSTEHSDIMLRFAKVFDMSYTRFNDLKQAEGQAREAKIELSLERVRNKTMAMYNSKDVGDTVATMFDELVKLGVEKSVRCGVGIIDHTKYMELWTATNQDSNFGLIIGRVDMTIHPMLEQTYAAWKNKESFFSYLLEGSDRESYFRALIASPEYHTPYTLETIPERQINSVFFFPEGCLFAFTTEAMSTEVMQLFKRFTVVFGLTYRRYLDLQKAEAQAKEARVEAALERVRSKTMAMHNSRDVGETIAAMFDEFVKLGIETVRCGILIGDDTREMEVWTARSNPDGIATLIIGRLDMMIHPLLQGINDAWKDKKSTFEYPMIGEDLKDYYRAINNANFYPVQFDIDSLPATQFLTDFFFRDGAVFAFTAEPLPENAIQILTRFAGVFGQTYRRYLDLQKAEAQAREAKIEAALEKVRSRTMAMQHSEELADTSVVLFQQLIGLGIEPNRLFIGIIKDNSGDIELWATEEDGSKLSTRFSGNIHGNGSIQKMYEGWKAQKSSIIIDMSGKVLKDYFNYLQKELKVPFKLGLSQKRRVQHMAYFSQGFIGMACPDEQPAETIRLTERFAGVFNLTYTRFNDLQKAEAQAQEARIEAALERVRGRAMAMHRSSDLNTAVLTVFEELEKLDLEIIRCGIGIIDKENRVGDIWTTVKMGEELLIQVSGKEPFNIHPLLQGTFDAWLAQRDFSYVLEGEDMAAYYKAVASTNFNLPESHSILMETEGLKQYYYTPTFQTGNLYAFKDIPFHEDGKKIIQRFAAVLNLTFNRFFDLQRAEAQAREAVKQASVDRVRAEIASMRTTNDLDRITPLVWNELTILGIPFIRCGVFIINEQEQLIHTYLSTPDGMALAAFDLQFDSGGIGQNVLPAWRNNQVATIHWSEEEFATFTRNLVEQGTVKSQERYVTEHPDISLDLHFFPFLQGMLYVGNTAPLSADDMDLAQSLASAFSTAYARYEDFNRLELAKVQVENTLTELRSAQDQLVQREKMASLGELTAGIAHEIQNPLNFVNNFSEVNQEMIDEMEEELKSGNIEEALAIAADIKQNEEKINHHGKRADSIVKGMLEHSRTGGGEKLPTNMNTLADEFLRLSYHGLRAKDKIFNAEMVTHFDETLPKVNVIQQDMGRVLLNLFNNAFYSVNQKKKTAAPGYKPEVMVTTLTQKGQLILKVRDNGGGIPNAIKDKIMQPFFTTKPTGEGTGLGLSLSYDIVVKGHGGTIKVETKEGQYTEFIITLPLI